MPSERKRGKYQKQRYRGRTGETKGAGGGDAPGRAGRVSAKIKPELLMLMLRRKIKSVL